MLRGGTCKRVRKLLLKGVYSVEVSGSGGEKLLWEVVDDNVVHNLKDNDDILLQGFYFKFV